MTMEPEISISTSNSKPPSKPSSKRLLFDRRYGWVFDEWKDPSQEALSGGRGMFCILPLATALLKTASQSINLAANTAVKVLERPNLLSPQELKASFDDRFHKFMSSIQKPEFNLFAIEGNSTLHATESSSHPHAGSSESQMASTT
ncbi:uncharacterized protein LOC100248156 [Vitis vinifera]|nr:uncharacterized protein LOC100248156 [Vitis vinifera]|eukprot:XP_002274416.1 PREDICTED: uncharacterized protein LOC100248156 [Vitis vinifera]